MELKLNTKRTFYIGFAFFSILMLWQIYNTYCPIFLTDLLVRRFGGSSKDYAYLIGSIMAMDNVVALVLLPIFGSISDKTKSKLGKRMPYIIIGTLLSVVLFPLIAVSFIYNQLIWLIIIMGIVILAMNIYRAPAVALMPDITPKPLRSKANAIINFVGYIGAIVAGGIAIVFSVIENKDTGLIEYSNNLILLPFIITAIFMILSLVVLILKIKENKLAEEMKEELLEGEKFSEAEEVSLENKQLGINDRFNLKILLVSIFLWFFAFNAIETFGSSFGLYYLEGASSGWWGTAVIIMTISSIVAFIPAGWISSKLGRKNSVLLGLLLMLIGVGIASILKTPMLFYPFIGLAGVGWAWVNVNSYPMVVELAHKDNIGKLTGWYYTSSMLAQSITPICVGFLFKWLGYGFLFVYSTIFTIFAIWIFSFYRVKRKDTTVKISIARNNKQK